MRHANNQKIYGILDNTIILFYSILFYSIKFITSLSPMGMSKFLQLSFLQETTSTYIKGYSSSCELD